jgi:glyoxylase-like metal-dependent hydrolase (beta-lactamase superfamily II)
MRYKLIVVGGLETNCGLVYCPAGKECAVVDPGAEPERIIAAIAEEGLRPVLLINTHGHVDHTGANREIKDKYGLPLLIHAADKDYLGRTHNLELSLFLGAHDSPPADRLLADGDVIEVGRGRLRVLHTPGHTPGGICLLGDGFLLSGDTLFFEGVGRTDLPGGDPRRLVSSIRDKLMTLPDDIVVLPGHGPLTTIGQERAANA